MFSSYRLGDLILVGLTDDEKKQLVKENPDTIGYDYLTKNVSIMKTVLKYLDKYNHLLPKDIENSTVIHIRIGDVMAGTTKHEKGKRPLSIDYLKNISPKDSKIYIIGKCHFSSVSSKNVDESIELSEKYKNDVINELNATYYDGGHPDIDLCCAIKAKLFIQGRGYFSKLIVEIRKVLKLYSLETDIFTSR
jgi:hypothetical protein